VRPFLLIAPYFAPQAAVGAYRWVKLARHLPRLGFRPVVLAATFPDDARDESLLQALPPEIEIAEQYLDPNLLGLRSALQRLSPRSSGPPSGSARPIEGLRPFRSLFDRCTPHAVHAARAAVDLARRARAEAVVVSAGPFSAIPVGIAVRRALGLPLILDFRDPWGLHESGHGASLAPGERIRRRIVSALEKRSLVESAHLIANTRGALDAYQARYPFLAGRASFVRNHFDMGLYDPPGQGEAPPSRFTLIHTGTLRADTTVDDIGAALRRLIDREHLTPSDLVFRQMGRLTRHEYNRMAELGLTAYFEAQPAVPQRDVLKHLRRAHVLISMFDPAVKLRISAKTYDYLASGMPIVSITGNPEVDELLAGDPRHARVQPRDIDGLVRALEPHLAAWRTTRALPRPGPPPAEFSAETAAQRVAAVLQGVLSHV
jgi:hypothetical protein